MVLLAAPKQQEPLPPVVLPEPIDSSVFIAKEYRPRPLAFLKPFGAHVPRLSTPRSDVPTSTSVRGVHVRGAVEEARLPFDSYAMKQSNPRRAELNQVCHSRVRASPPHRPRHSPRRAAASHQSPTGASPGASSRAEVRALASRLEEGLARGGSAAALEELWRGVQLHR